MKSDRSEDVAQLLRRLQGSMAAKERLSAFLAVLAGQQTPATAALDLGVSTRRFRALRSHLLQAALTSLEPQPVGRPSHQSAEVDKAVVADLQNELQDLRIDVRAAQIREEIALAMPHLLRRKRRGKRKTKRQRRQNSAAANNAMSSS